MNDSGGIGVVSVLTIVFVVLKLTDTIDWAWIWVLSPIWIAGLLSIVLSIFLLLGYFILDKKATRRRY